MELWQATLKWAQDNDCVQLTEVREGQWHILKNPDAF